MTPAILKLAIVLSRLRIVDAYCSIARFVLVRGRRPRGVIADGFRRTTTVWGEVIYAMLAPLGIAYVSMLTWLLIKGFAPGTDRVADVAHGA